MFNEERTFSCDGYSKDLGNTDVYANGSTKLNMKGAELWASCFNKSILFWRDNEYLKGALPKRCIMGKITPIINALYFEGHPESMHHGFRLTKILGCLYQVVYPGNTSY